MLLQLQCEHQTDIMKLMRELSIQSGVPRDTQSVVRAVDIEPRDGSVHGTEWWFIFSSHRKLHVEAS
jgi:hypothetical protein